MYPNLKKLKRLLSAEFSSLNSRNRLLEILYTDEKEEKGLQLFLSGLMSRYKIDKDSNFTFKKESKDWGTANPKTNNSEKCDFILDDEFFEGCGLKCQSFIELKYVNGYDGLPNQIIKLNLQLSKWGSDGDAFLGIIFHEFKECDIKTEYETRCGIIEENIHPDFYNKIEITPIEFLEGGDYAYKVDLYLNRWAYNALEMDEIIVDGSRDYLEDFIGRFDTKNIIRMEGEESYHIFTYLVEFLKVVDEFYGTYGYEGDGVNIQSSNQMYLDVLEFLKDKHFSKKYHW